MAKTDVRTKLKPNLKISEPSLYRVLYLNDNVTTMEFVVESLVNHFDYTTVTAMEITVEIHEKGSATVAVLPYEIAEQKGSEIMVEARHQGFPLKVKLEKQA